MKPRTYKREAATALMGLNLALFLYAVVLGPGEYGEWTLSIAKHLFLYSGFAFTAAFFAEWLSTQSPWAIKEQGK